MLIGLYDNGILVRDTEAILFTTEEEWELLVEITKRIYERRYCSVSRNNNRFSQINGLDTGSRYDRRHPERKETSGFPGTTYKTHSRMFQTQKMEKRKGK